MNNRTLYSNGFTYKIEANTIHVIAWTKDAKPTLPVWSFTVENSDFTRSGIIKATKGVPTRGDLCATIAKNYLISIFTK